MGSSESSICVSILKPFLSPERETMTDNESPNDNGRV